MGSVSPRGSSVRRRGPKKRRPKDFAPKDHLLRDGVTLELTFVTFFACSWWACGEPSAARKSYEVPPVRCP